MSKVTSKLQVTIPKAIADAYRIRPGTEIGFFKAADGIRISVPEDRSSSPRLGPAERLALFDVATRRQAARNRAWKKKKIRPPKTRGWTREELYARGRPS